MRQPCAVCIYCTYRATSRLSTTATYTTVFSTFCLSLLPSVLYFPVTFLFYRLLFSPTFSLFFVFFVSFIRDFVDFTATFLKYSFSSSVINFTFYSHVFAIPSFIEQLLTKHQAKCLFHSFDLAPTPLPLSVYTVVAINGPPSLSLSPLCVEVEVSL